MEVDRLVVQLGKTLNSLRGEEDLFKSLLESVKDAWEQSEASASTSVQLNASVLRKRTRAKGKGDSGKSRLKAALQSAELKLREALLRARIRSTILRMSEQTKFRRAGGYALVIDGTCLRAALHPENKIIFLTVAVRCKAVICCRVTPAQKAQVCSVLVGRRDLQVLIRVFFKLGYHVSERKYAWRDNSRHRRRCQRC